MTYEEARERLLKTQMPGNEEQRIFDSLCLLALEKQIPIKPVQHGKIGDDDCWFECSICHEYITSYWTGDDNYCGNCGQKIDWSEEK